jgi:hypothetical protein|tara:strand:+ start:2453 stop:2671 length:219 start_codon:yes stop_codon:yes gene_type:complete
MPIWLRKFTYKQIYDTKKAEADAVKKQSQGRGTNFDLNSSKQPKIPKTAFNPPTNKSFKKSSPNYVSKASKK